jgi:hypothetical protein
LLKNIIDFSKMSNQNLNQTSKCYAFQRFVIQHIKTLDSNTKKIITLQ